MGGRERILSLALGFNRRKSCSHPRFPSRTDDAQMMTAEWLTPRSLLTDDTRVIGQEGGWQFVLAKNHQKPLGAV